MKRYRNLEGHSGVTGYEAGHDYIKVQFGHEAIYLYTYASTGKRMIKRMKQLAEAGKGLSTYISRYVRNKYERKFE